MRTVFSWVPWQLVIFVLSIPLVGLAQSPKHEEADPKQIGAGAHTDRTGQPATGSVIETRNSTSVTSLYVIGPSDVLDIDAWREKEISQKLTVRPDGMITLPLIGDVVASGKTTGNLAAEITQRFKVYLTDPQVTVILVEVRSKWFGVVGQVNKPGQYPLVRPMTLLEALSQAGGFQEFAKPNKSYVVRYVNGKAVRLQFHYNRVLKGKNLKENIEVSNGDTIVVP